MGISWPAKSSNILGSSNQREVRWVEHMARLRKKKNSYRVLVDKPDTVHLDKCVCGR
jgi:hypothetical protein